MIVYTVMTIKIWLYWTLIASKVKDADSSEHCLIFVKTNKNSTNRQDEHCDELLCQ